MKPLKRALCLVLAVFMLAGMLQPLAAPDLTLTAVNDQFLPLTSDTMPVRKNGELYVPYSVFTGALGLHASYSGSQQLLVLYNWDHTLNFSLSNNYVYDENDTSYSQPPYSIGGTTYVSVKLICGVFGFSYSTISAAYPVLRIVNDNATLSDHTFVANNADTITRMVSAYQSGSSGGGTVTAPDPVIPVTPPKPEEKIPQPSTVYLAFSGAPTEDTGAVLDTLASYGRTATFFLSAREPLAGGDLVRRTVSEGHALGLVVTADAALAEPAALTGLLDAANRKLLNACGVQTRLVLIDNGSDALSASQRDALAAAGYRLWDATLDAREHTRSAYRAAQVVLQGFQTSNAPAVVRLRQGKNTADTLAYLLRYMRETSIASAPMRVSTPPINLIGETR